MALIVFTVIFSIAIIQIGEKGKPIVEAMDRLTAAIVNVINIVMKLAPLGLGCYFAILIGSNGSDVIGPLSKSNCHVPVCDRCLLLLFHRQYLLISVAAWKVYAYGGQPACHLP